MKSDQNYSINPENDDIARELAIKVEELKKEKLIKQLAEAQLQLEEAEERDQVTQEVVVTQQQMEQNFMRQHHVRQAEEAHQSRLGVNAAIKGLISCVCCVLCIGALIGIIQAIVRGSSSSNQSNEDLIPDYYNNHGETADELLAQLIGNATNYVFGESE